MKKIIFSISVLVTLLILVFGVYSSIGNNNFSFIKNLVPKEIRNIVKNTFFSSQVLRYEKKLLNQEIEYLSEKLIYFVDQFPSVYPYENIKINDYELTKYKFPSFKRKYLGAKSIGYLSNFKQKIIFVTDRGNFYFFDENEINKEAINLGRIQSNLINDINKKILEVNEMSIRDMKLINNFIYVSLNSEIKKDCFNTSIFRAKFNENYLYFEPFYKPLECINVKNNEFQMMQSGGKLLKLDSNNILFTIGDYRDRPKAQDDGSIFGKTLKINLSNPKKYEIFTLGHRNQQGINLINDLIFSSEHGPYGGDEINILNGKGNNLGWPISSYGKHYDGTEKKEAPLYNSHKEYGFVEPILYFKESIGPSQIIKNFYKNRENYLYIFLTSLKGKKIFEIEYNIKKNKAKIINEFEIGERIRDIHFNQKNETYILLLENTPSIALFEKKNTN